MNYQAVLDSSGFYRFVRRFSPAYLKPKESELCHKLTSAFENFSQEKSDSNKETNAIGAYRVTKEFLENYRGGFFNPNLDWDLPSDEFPQIVSDDLVNRMRDSRVIHDSDDVIRFTNEYMAGVKNEAEEILEDKLEKVEVSESSKDNDSGIKIDSTLVGYDRERGLVYDALVLQLKQRDELLARGLKPSNGVLLFGPPGTGKTSIVKEISKEEGINFYYVRPADILDKYVGESPKKLRKTFSQAKQNQPAIVFMDEAESLLKSRGSDHSGHLSEVLAECLTEIEGLDSSAATSVVFSTNRLDLIDEAIVSRIPPLYRIEFGLPDLDTRKKIFEHKFSKLKGKVGHIDNLAKASEGWSGRDIENFVQAVGWRALKKGMEGVSPQLIREVYDEFR